MPRRSKLRLAACALALAPAACAPRARGTVPAAAPTAPPPAEPAPRATEERTPQRANAAPSAADPVRLREHVGRLLELVASLAREQDWAAARDTAADALRALADAIAVAPTELDRAHVARLAEDVRAEAAALARTGDPSLERSDLARAGLLAAARALEELAAPPEGSILARLLANARAAANAIDVHSPFSFERARIQDAFRAAADAFLLFAEREPAGCWRREPDASASQVQQAPTAGGMLESRELGPSSC